MLVKNITDRNTPKVIGVGHVWLQPGEEKYVPDTGLYANEVDQYGKLTGKKVIINSIMNQVRLNMLEIVEDKEEQKKEPEKEQEPVKQEVVEQEEEVKPAAKTKRSSKAKAQ